MDSDPTLNAFATGWVRIGEIQSATTGAGTLTAVDANTFGERIYLNVLADATYSGNLDNRGVADGGADAGQFFVRGIKFRRKNSNQIIHV